MGQGTVLKGWHLNGKSVMKKAVMAMIVGAVLLTVSSCGKAKNSEEAQTNVISSTAEPDGSTGEVQKTQNDNITGSGYFIYIRLFSMVSILDKSAKKRQEDSDS